MAQQLIRAGRVRWAASFRQAGHRRCDGAGADVDQGRVLSPGEGEKLIAALEPSRLQVEGRICLDGGIFTGGFTTACSTRSQQGVRGGMWARPDAWSLRTDERWS